MKRFLIGLLIGLMVLAVTPFVYAADEVKVIYNGRYMNFDVPPQVINGRTMMPVRFAEMLGANVDWDDSTSTVTITKPAESSHKYDWGSPFGNYSGTNKDEITVTTGTEKDLFYSYLIFNKGLYTLNEISKKNFPNLTDNDKWLLLGAMSMIDNANDYITGKVFPENLKTIQSDMVDTYTVNKTIWWLLWQTVLDNKSNPESSLKELRVAKAIMEYESSNAIKRPSYIWYDKNRLTLGSKYGNPAPEQVISSNSWARWLKNNEFRIKEYPKAKQ